MKRPHRGLFLYLQINSLTDLSFLIYSHSLFLLSNHLNSLQSLSYKGFTHIHTFLQYKILIGCFDPTPQKCKILEP